MREVTSVSNGYKVRDWSQVESLVNTRDSRDSLEWFLRRMAEMLTQGRRIMTGWVLRFESVICRHYMNV